MTQAPITTPLEPLLKWTGHPLADVGVATICAMVNKTDPTAVTEEDLDEVGTQLRAAYNQGIMLSYLSCIFPNSAYVNPTMKDCSKEVAVRRLLSPHRGDADPGTETLRCVFSRQPATRLLERSQMPMLTGADVMNFFPSGRSDLCVAGPYLLAIQALALGGRRSEGKLLIVHCDNPDWTLRFANRYLSRNRVLLDLARTAQLPDRDGPHEMLERECAGWDNQKKRAKYPDAKAPTSLLMDDLLEIVTDASTGSMAKSPSSVTAYLMSNSGQGPSLAIEHIPGEFVSFLQELAGPKYASRWKQLVARCWRSAKAGESEEAAAPSDQPSSPPTKRGAKKPKPAKSTVPPGPGRSRNELYNDLLPIFETGTRNWHAATKFIRRHLLSDPNRLIYSDKAPPSRNGPPRFSAEQLELIDWELTSLFLERVLGMNSDRLKKLREFADRLATLINDHNDKSLFRGLVFTSSEYEYRGLLTKVQRRYAHERNQLLLGLDDYLDLFMSSDSDEPVHWSLIRDLISIRLVESLFHKKFFDRTGNAEVLDPSEDPAREPASAT